MLKFIFQNIAGCTNNQDSGEEKYLILTTIHDSVIILSVLMRLRFASIKHMFTSHSVHLIKCAGDDIT
jgi:hypothetical protein